MIELIPVDSLTEIQEQRENYMNELPYSQELYAEEKVLESQCIKIIMDSAWVGYFCVNPEKILYEFYLIKSSLIFSQEIFKFLLDMNYIVASECKSFDYLLMSLCFDFHKKTACSAYLFRDNTDVKYSLSAVKDVSFRLATKEDFNSILGMSGDFFYNLRKSIFKEEVFVFYSNNELIGVGSCQKIWDSMNYYDIGMVVSEKHRNKGIGTFIIIKLKEYCYNINRIPVCGCWYFNYASKKTLEKAGFITKHRIIRFDFK